MQGGLLPSLQGGLQTEKAEKGGASKHHQINFLVCLHNLLVLKNQVIWYLEIDIA
jgi:hypothetical protein